jgi:type II secretory pathway pseudopilin PulG
MVVVGILAILMLIGVPTFLGARTRAQNAAAKAHLRQGLTVEILYYGSYNAFSGDNSAGGDLDSIGPDIAWGSIDASAKGVIASATGPNDNTAILRNQSTTGTVYCLGRIADTADAGTYYTTGCDGTEDTTTVATWPHTAANW